MAPPRLALSRFRLPSVSVIAGPIAAAGAVVVTLTWLSLGPITISIAALGTALAVLGVDRLATGTSSRSRGKSLSAQNILEATECLIVVLDQHGRIVQINRACERLTGYRSDELAGQSFLEVLVATVETDRVFDSYARLAEGHVPNKRVLPWRIKSGGTRHVACTDSVLFGDDERPRYVIVSGVDLTEHLESDRVLRKSEERFSLAVQSTATGIWDWDLISDQVYFSPVWKAQLGYEPDQITDSFATWEEALHPDDRAPTLAALKAYLDGTASEFRREVRLRHRNGSYRWILTQGVALRGPNGRPTRMAGSHLDVTDRKQTEERLRLLESVVVHMADAVVITEATPHGRFGRRIFYANAAFAQLTGYQPGEVIGRSLHLLRGPASDADAIARIRAALAEQVPISVELLNYRKDGEPFWAEESLFPVADSEGVVTHWVAVLRDTTTRKQDEERLRESELRLRRARDAAEAANRAKSEFLANMSHEVRTPMGAILGYTDMLLNPNISPAARTDALQAIRRNGLHLLQVINDILDLSKVESGKMELELRPYSPWQSVQEAVATLKPRAEEKGLQLNAFAVGRFPRQILTDPTRVYQILINFVGNAIKFTEKGTVEVRLRLDDAARVLCFEVADTGIGMTAEAVQNLFTPFHQVDGSATRRHGGTGLGLTISKRLADALGGEVRVFSRPNRGSTFSLQLPLRADDLTDLADPHEAATDPEPKTVQEPAIRVSRLNGRVLLAEDGKDNQLILRYFLEAAGLSVDVVETGRAAVNAALNGNFGVVLMDMQMPEMDGYEATAELRQCGYTGPVIALTAHAMRGDEEKCRQAGCDDYLTKPIDAEKLTRTLARYLSTAHAEPSASAGLDDLIKEYAASLPERLAELKASLAAGDRKRLIHLAHQTAGASGMYGFTTVGETAKLLEQAASEGEDDSLLSDLLDELAEVIHPRAD